MSTTTPGSYTIVGGGAIGGTLAVHLHLQGAGVRIIDADPEHVAAINREGLRILTPGGELSARIPATTPDAEHGPLGAVLLAVKSQATPAALEMITPRLAPEGWVASLQNGLNEDTIAAAIGAERTVAAFVDLFADATAPGVITDGGFGTIAIGEHQPPQGRHAGPSERVTRLAADLGHWGPVVLSDDVPGYLWSKLGFGAMLTATALADEDMSVLIDRHRVVMIALVREVAAVAAAEGIALKDFDDFEPYRYLADVPADETHTSIDRLVAWLAGQTKTRSGIWRDLAVRRRPTEVPYQYATVLERATRHGIAVDVLRGLIDTIRQLEAGTATMGPELLEQLAQLVPAAPMERTP